MKTVFAQKSVTQKAILDRRTMRKAGADHREPDVHAGRSRRPALMVLAASLLTLAPLAALEPPRAQAQSDSAQELPGAPGRGRNPR